VVNLSLLSFTSTASTATSTVQVGSTFKVTHDFRPSSNANLYVITVTIQNISQSAVNIRYRRVVDWDVEPSAYTEYVSVNNGSSQALIYDNNDGFTTADPLGAQSSGYIASLKTGNFSNAGPADIGALLDFSFSSVSAGGQVIFTLYYGAAPTLSGAQAALSSVSVQGYSLAQPGTANGLSQGTPNTFALGFNTGTLHRTSTPLLPLALQGPVVSTLDEEGISPVPGVGVDRSPLQASPAVAGATSGFDDDWIALAISAMAAEDSGGVFTGQSLLSTKVGTKRGKPTG
jgi:hypothetical protein